jgi:hypothetical protein
MFARLSAGSFHSVPYRCFFNNFYWWPPVTLFPKHNAQLISFAGKTTYMVVLIKTDDNDTTCPTATFPVCLNFPYTETRWYSNIKDISCEISVKALRNSPSLNQNQKIKCKKWNERRTTCSSQPWSSFMAAVFPCYFFSPCSVKVYRYDRRHYFSMSWSQGSHN